MSKIIQRLLIFFLGVPLVLALVFFKQFDHLVLNLAIVVFSGFAAYEMHGLLSTKTKILPKGLLITLSTLIPIFAYFCVLFGWNFIYINYVVIFTIVCIIAYEIFSSKTFENSNYRISSSILVVLYSGVLLTYLTRLTACTDSVALICLFLLMIFICDSLAWVFGMLFGKNNRGVIAVSPNKSIAGFIGAFIGCIGIGIIVKTWFWPNVFTGPLWKMIILSILVAFSGILGDLAESVFKRSANIKDSGHIILGRGGVLDSIDSILLAAPVFYIAVHILYSI